MSPTTTADLVTNNIAPKHRAIIFTALELLHQETFSALTEIENNTTMAPTLAQRIAEFHRWHMRELREIKQALFANSFPEDLDIVKHFQKDLPPMQKTTQAQAPMQKLF